MVKANIHARSRRNSKDEKNGADEKPDYRRRDSVLVMDIIGSSNRCKDRENRRKS